MLEIKVSERSVTQSSIEGLSGTVKLDSSGRRSSFELDLITLTKYGFTKVSLS